MWIGWLTLIIILSIVEISTISLICIWFIPSALVALIMSFFTESFFWQFFSFVILGVILLITTKPMVDKWIKPKKINTNLDRIVGMTGVVTEEIKKNIIGEVKVDGKKWSAVSNKKINAGEEVIIEAIDGVKVVVRKEGE